MNRPDALLPTTTLTDPMMTLAQRQEALVRALVTGSALPPGFDTDRLQVAADALLRKRAGLVARHLTLVHAELGCEFTTLFMAWARGAGADRCGRDGTSWADALAFAEHLVTIGRVDARHVPEPRRGRRRQRMSWHSKRRRAY